MDNPMMEEIDDNNLDQDPNGTIDHQSIDYSKFDTYRLRSIG